MVVTIVLAAGQGRRLGGAKALLLWRLPDGRELPLAAVHAEQRLANESDVVVVVARQEVADHLRSWLPPDAQLLVSTEDARLGPAGSIACAARWLVEQPWWESGPVAGAGRIESLALITPVDCLPAAASVAAELIAALRRRPEACAARPRFGHRRGHPVALRPDALRPYGVGLVPTLRDRLRELGGQVIDLEVEDPAVLVDVDTPEDAEACGQAPVRFAPHGARR